MEPTGDELWDPNLPFYSLRCMEPWGLTLGRMNSSPEPRIYHVFYGLKLCLKNGISGCKPIKKSHSGRENKGASIAMIKTNPLSWVEIKVGHYTSFLLLYTKPPLTLQLKTIWVYYLTVL